ARGGEWVIQRWPAQAAPPSAPSTATAAAVGSARRSARPQASAIARGRGSRDHSEPGRRRFRARRRISRDVGAIGEADRGGGDPDGLAGGAGVAVSRRASPRASRRDRSMIGKYAWRDHRRNFLTTATAGPRGDPADRLNRLSVVGDLHVLIVIVIDH